MSTKGAEKVALPTLRFAQSWEDADALLRALDIRPEAVCLSIISGGDNTLAMLTRSPQKVIAIDQNPAQIYCLELKVAAFRELSHTEMLVLLGSKPGNVREHLYRRCRSALSESAQQFWDAHTADLTKGVGSCGTFEHHFAKFRGNLHRFAVNEKVIERMFRAGDRDVRDRYYQRDWDNWRWKMAFTSAFSGSIVSAMGRDTAFLKNVKSKWSDAMLDRFHRVLVELDPAENPYLQWILLGRHTTALPCALRQENFETIRANLDRLEWQCITIDDYLSTVKEPTIDRFNLGDIFEPMNHDTYGRLLRRLCSAGKPGGRMVSWNMVAEHEPGPAMSHLVRPLEALGARLEEENRSFMYRDLVIEGLLEPSAFA